MSKKQGLAALFCLSVLVTTASAQSFRNTIKVETDDTPAQIIDKAAHVVPTASQLAALNNAYIAFVHFGPNTFTRVEWGSGKEDPKIFNLQHLDTDQWCEVMKDAGMKLVILTAKHHDGFVLWQSRYTTHGIMSTPYKNGKGDILKELAASCRKYGIKLGVYLSPADLYQIESPDGLYGNLSSYTRRTIPRAVPGRPFANKTTFSFEVDDYNEYFLNQLFELLTEYGPIDEVWFDGAHPKRKGGQRYNYTAWRQLIRTLAPHAVIFGREDIRWCGNEAGKTRDTEWNVIPYSEDPNTMTEFHDLTKKDLGSQDALLSYPKPYYLHYQPAETNTSIRAGWFYRDDTHQTVRTADDVFDIYERAVGGNSIFLLNIPPNREGRFADRDVAVLREVGRRIRETYGENLFKGAKTVKQQSDMVITLKRPATVNRISISEDIAKHGERVEQHAVDAWLDGGWKEIASATNIGYRRILRFADVTSNKFRLRILSSRLEPSIAEISAFHYQSPVSHDEVAAPQNTALPKSNWKVLKVDSEVKPQHEAVAAIDSDPRTYWMTTASDSLHFISLDFGTALTIKGMAYTPQQESSAGLMERGELQVSDDGQTWKTIAELNFGNLINDPTKRYHYLSVPVTTRYIRLVATMIAGGGHVFTVAELDFL